MRRTDDDGEPSDPMVRRYSIARYGRFRLDCLQLRRPGPTLSLIDDTGVYVVLEIDSSREVELGWGRRDLLLPLPRFLRYIRWWLHGHTPDREGPAWSQARYTRIAPANVTAEHWTDAQASIVYMRHSTGELMPGTVLVRAVEEALREVEEAHPDLQADPDEDYAFMDPELARESDRIKSLNMEWREQRGAWPIPNRVEPGDLVVQYGPFHVHRTRAYAMGTLLSHVLESVPVISPRRPPPPYLIQFDGNSAGTRLLSTYQRQTYMIPNADPKTVLRWVEYWLRYVQDSINIGGQMLTETNDPALQSDLRKGLALRQHWLQLVESALPVLKKAIG